MPNPFLDLSDGQRTDLPAGDRFPAAGHLWSQPEIDALILARAARRPLLVRGEAGSGKSQIARAAAAVLGEGELLVEVIHPRFEALDLLFRFDVLARLADAQINQLDPSNERYVQPGPLWQALEPAEPGRTPVLLIDEIDKADSDIPNALLDVLGNRSFAVPPLAGRTVRAESGAPPLIVITTNEERELPPAFVRRCVVLNLNPPAWEQPFVEWLIARGRVHGHLDIAENAADPAKDARRVTARQVWADRQVAVGNGFPKPGLAEYIDLLTALHELTAGEPEDARAGRQIYWLQRLGAYALVKNKDQLQDREPVLPPVGREPPKP